MNSKTPQLVSTHKGAPAPLVVALVGVVVDARVLDLVGAPCARIGIVVAAAAVVVVDAGAAVAVVVVLME